MFISVCNYRLVKFRMPMSHLLCLLPTFRFVLTVRARVSTLYFYILRSARTVLTVTAHATIGLTWRTGC